MPCGQGWDQALGEGGIHRAESSGTPKDSPPPLQTAATPLRKATKLCHTWGLLGQGLHTPCNHRPGGPPRGLMSAVACDLATRGRSPARPGTDL